MKLYNLGSITALAGAVVAACSGGSTASGTSTADGGGGTGDTVNLAKCKLACAAPTEGPCKDGDVADCTNTCTVFLEGLKASCVQCVVEQSGWTGQRCAAECRSCPCIDSFGPSGVSGGGAKCPIGTTPSCDPLSEKCTGYSLAKTSTGPCVTACQ